MVQHRSHTVEGAVKNCWTVWPLRMRLPVAIRFAVWRVEQRSRNRRMVE